VSARNVSSRAESFLPPGWLCHLSSTDFLWLSSICS
jgi:hypothetical protein